MPARFDASTGRCFLPASLNPGVLKTVPLSMRGEGEVRAGARFRVFRWRGGGRAVAAAGRARVLRLLAGEVRAAENAGSGAGCRVRRSRRRSCFLEVPRAGGGGTLRVYCAMHAGRYAFVTSDGDMIRSGDLAEAARVITAAAGAAG